LVYIGDIKLNDFPLILAPMEDVSDPPFRALCKKNGADLMFTEFISSEGLIRDAVKSMQKLDIFEYERPIGVQIFGSDIESMKKATEVCEKVNPDIIDINYGCPVKKVACKGSGAGILQNIPKMVEMTKEIVKSTSLPVTVKTRLGWDDNSKFIVVTYSVIVSFQLVSGFSSINVCCKTHVMHTPSHIVTATYTPNSSPQYSLKRL